MDKKDMDVTELVDKLVPDKWICPHCCRTNDKGPEADNILMEHFVYIEQCDTCGYLHCWRLTLSDAFKRRVVNFLLQDEQKKKYR